MKTRVALLDSNEQGASKGSCPADLLFLTVIFTVCFVYLYFVGDFSVLISDLFNSLSLQFFDFLISIKLFLTPSHPPTLGSYLRLGRYQ